MSSTRSRSAPSRRSSPRDPGRAVRHLRALRRPRAPGRPGRRARRGSCRSPRPAPAPMSRCPTRATGRSCATSCCGAPSATPTGGTATDAPALVHPPRHRGAAGRAPAGPSSSPRPRSWAARPRLDRLTGGAAARVPCPPMARPGAPMTTGTRPRVVLLRGHHANVWDLRPWERLRDEYDVAVLVTGSNVHQVEGLDLEIVPVRTPRDALPGARVAGAAAYALGERYRDLDRHLAGADIVHAAEIGTWFAAQAAGLRARMGFALALTVWETIAWRSTYRWPRERGYRRRVLAAGDHFLPATERARDALLLEGVAPERMAVVPAGHRPRPLRLARRSGAAAHDAPDPVGRAPGVGEGPPGRAARLRRAAPRPGRDRRTPTSSCSSSATGPSASAWSATRASSASPTASSSAPRSPTTRCRRSTRRPRRSSSRACPRGGGRSSSAWSSSRRSPPARR